MKTRYKDGFLTPSLGAFLMHMNERDYEFITEVIVDTNEKKVFLFCESLHCSIPCEIGKNGTVDFSNSK